METGHPVGAGPAQDYPLGIRGVRRYDVNAESPLPWLFVLDGDADDTTVTRLVELLPEGASLSFYDRSFPSPSDPGAYARFERDGTRYRMRRGNHGWTTGPEALSAGELIDYFRRCAPFNRGASGDEVMTYDGLRADIKRT